MTMCELFGNHCFKTTVDGRYDGQIKNRCETRCLPDCEYQVYLPAKSVPKRIERQKDCKVDTNDIHCQYLQSKLQSLQPTIDAIRYIHFMDR